MGSTNSTLGGCSQVDPWSQPIAGPEGHRWDPESRTRRKEHPVQTPARAVTAGPLPSIMVSCRAVLSRTAGTRGLQGKPAWDPTGLITGCLGEEPKAGQRRSLGGLGRNKCGNRGVRGGKGLVVCRQLSGHALYLIRAICPVPNEIPSWLCSG